MSLFINIGIIAIIILGTGIIIYRNFKHAQQHHCPIGKDCECQLKQQIKQNKTSDS